MSATSVSATSVSVPPVEFEHRRTPLFGRDLLSLRDLSPDENPLPYSLVRTFTAFGRVCMRRRIQPLP